MDTKEIVYLLLQDKYLKIILGKDKYTEDEVMAQSHMLFPMDWSYVDYDLKNKLISKAIKEKRNLREIYEREMNPDELPPRLDTK
ncbi:MAG: hypothetical protein IKE63_03840 [Bacilli bacterium]|nr:hypothetical protein [Bacilli bacterium]